MRTGGLASRHAWAPTAAHLVLTTAVSSALWVLRWVGPAPRNGGDGYWYQLMSLRMSGMGRYAAEHLAARLSCQWVQHEYPASLEVQRADCLHARPYVATPEYVHIFSNRVGLPALGAALRPLAGDAAVPVAVALSAVACCLLLWCAVRAAGASRPVATAAGCLVLLLPSGAWLAKVDTEAPAAACMVAVVLGLVLVRARRPVAGLVVVAAGLLALYLVRPPTAVAMAGVVVLVGLLWSVRARSARAATRSLRWAAALAGVGALAGVAMELTLHLTGAPGLRVTVTDLVTAHFHRAAPPSLWDAYLHVMDEARPHVLMRMFSVDLFWTVALVVAVLALWRELGDRCAPWLGIVLVALAQVVVHPMQTEAARLTSSAGITVATGLAVVLGWAGRGWTERRGAGGHSGAGGARAPRSDSHGGSDGSVGDTGIEPVTSPV